MKVSVIVPVYNGEKFIQEALDSILAQTYRDFEVIVVNDGSKDGTADILRTYGSRIQVHLQENRGLIAARATGLAAAAGEWIAFLDADDIWLPTKLEKQNLVAERDSRYGIITTDFLSFRDETIECGSVKEWYAPRSGNVFEDLISGNWITPSAAMVRRECFNLVKTFDLGRQAFGEDWLMWMQITPQYPVYFVDEVLVRRRIHEQNMSRTNEEAQFATILRNFELLEKLVPGFKEHRALVDSAMFQICMNRGKRNLLKADTTHAAQKFKMALSHRPWSLTALIYRALAALPDRLLRSALSFKHNPNH